MIQVFSSFANDIITYDNNRTVPGWPALWVKDALLSRKTSFVLHTWSTPGITEIKKNTRNEDTGIILSVSEIDWTPPENETDLIMISTLKQEFNLSVLSDLRNTVCIDIQGFLRWDHGEKKRFDCDTIKTNGTIYIKATREEFSYINNHTNSRFIWIITNGWEDIEVLLWADSYHLPIQSWKFIDTIGAWDTFFSIFCACILDKIHLKESVQYAAAFTYKFLEAKNTQYSLQP